MCIGHWNCWGLRSILAMLAKMIGVVVQSWELWSPYPVNNDVLSFVFVFVLCDVGDEL